MSEESSDLQDKGNEISELYRALAQTRDEYIERTISHQEALDKIAQIRSSYQPTWWQEQVILLTIKTEFQVREIRRLMVTIGFLSLIIVTMLIYIILLFFHTA